jgi:DNA-binding response OmpR family regulator
LADAYLVDKENALTILVVDDYDSVRIAVSMILKKNGFRVLAAEDPTVARRIWKENRDAIDLLLVDIAMPMTTGPELVQELMHDGLKCPVIFATGTGDEQARKATRHLAKPVILQKPFSPEILLGAITDVLSRNRSDSNKSVAV